MHAGPNAKLRGGDDRRKAKAEAPSHLGLQSFKMAFACARRETAGTTAPAAARLDSEMVVREQYGFNGRKALP
jgi:hypothetical protein